MKKLPIYVFLMILLSGLGANPAIALRCGNNLIREGDSASEVRIILKNNGGEIIEKTHSGARGSKAVNSKTKVHSASHSVEKWFVRAPSGYGRPYCYELTFVGSILEEIGTGIECK